MTKYQINGIKDRLDFSYALKSIYEQIDQEYKEISDRIRRQIKLKYDREKGILAFSINKKIDIFGLNSRLSLKGLELKVL